MNLSVIIPTYREAENLGILLYRLAQVCADHELSTEIIVVDDDSQDGTVELCAEMAESGLGIGSDGHSTRCKNRTPCVELRLITRHNERGLSSAVICGMQEARGDVLICMDADLSHPPDSIPALYESLSRSESPADFVIGSRYVKGGSTAETWGFLRWVNSKVATWLALPFTRVNDPMAGFFGVRRESFDAANSLGLNPIGYKIGLELLVKSNAQAVEELPIHFEDRLHGTSKLNLTEQLNYIRHLGRLGQFKYPNLSRFASFAAVGSSGVIVDLSILALLLTWNISAPVASVVAIWLAMSWNFVLNRRWTFNDGDSSSRAADSVSMRTDSSNRVSVVHQYLKFCGSCLVGAVVNWTVRVSLVGSTELFSERPYLASLAGIVSGLAFNFTICNWLVFSRLELFSSPRTGDTRRTIAKVPVQTTSIESPTSAKRTMAADVVAGGHGVPARTATIVRAILFVGVLLGASWSFAYLDRPASDSPKKSKSRPTKQIKSGSHPQNDSPTTSVRTTKTDAQNDRGTKPDKAKPHNDLDVSPKSVIERLREDVTYLASDELEGRGVLTSGLDLAAQYIAVQFEKAQLDTSLYRQSPFQEFRLYSQGTQGAVQTLNLLFDGTTERLELQEDYTSILAAKTGRFSSEIAFVGFGITAPELNYDDYASIDVKDKCVLMLRHAPPVFGQGSEEEQKDRQRYLYLRTKIENARRHGAAAIIFCTDLKEIRRLRKIAHGERLDEPLLKVELTSEYKKGGLPTIHCHRSMLEKTLAKVGFDLSKSEEAINTNNEPASQIIPTIKVHGSVARVRSGQKLKNVLGMLPGTGSQKHEAIVLGAHYDHLGREGWGSLSIGANHAIHNGADDNASGTAILMEVARQLSARKKALNRTVLFIAFSGEELGLLGSKRYTRDPLIPLKDTIAMLNLDMVGRLRDQKLTVYGTGTSNVWPQMLEDYSAPHKIKITSRRGGYGPSDHASFYEKGIPVLHFFTGFHPQYHRPSDDIDLLNTDGMQQIASMVTNMIVKLSETESRPKRAAAEDSVGNGAASIEQLLAGSPKAKQNPLLGVVPIDKKGSVQIEQVVKGSGAALAGLRIGDQIETFDQQPLKNRDHLIQLIRMKKAGDKVKIQIKRNGIRLELDVTL